MAEYKFDTLKVRAGYNPKDHNDAVSVPIYSTASYEIGDALRFERIAAGEENGHLYSRLSNPTVAVLEERVNELEGGVAAVAVASGMAAITYSLLAVTERGGRILTTQQLYGGTIYNLDSLFQFNEPDVMLKDLQGKNRSFNEMFGNSALAGKIRLDYVTNFGAVISPFSAYLILLGIETLSERVDKQVANTRKIVNFLKTSDAVKWIRYPELEDSQYKKLADKYYKKGVGSTFSFGFNGNADQIYKLIDSVELFSYQANVGDARSLIVNVQKTTHGELSEEEFKLADIPEETIRLSIGLEDPEDLINDLKQAFKKALS